MSHNVFAALEFSIRKLARRNMADHEFEEFVNSIRRTKVVRVGPEHLTLHEYMVRHAEDIANWATGYRFQDLEDKLEEKKRHAIHTITTVLGWNR